MTTRYPPVSVARLLALFSIDLDGGSIVWKLPPKNHPRMLFKEAGFPRPNRRGKSYWIVKIDKHAYRRAQIILAVATGRWPDQCVDHIDGNSLNDRASNLRHASIAENARNHKGRTKSTQLPMGLREMPNGRFQARIAHDKITKHLGCFDDMATAAAAYAAARKELFREFA